MFSNFANWMSSRLGNSKTFILAILLIFAWLVTGPFFQYSDAWQLVVNTGTTIITFLMVFLLQNTQNRDTTAIQLKLDEIIRSLKGAHNDLLKVEELNDDDLALLKKRYEDLAAKVKEKKNHGCKDKGTPEL